MAGRVDAEIEKILPLLPLKDAANLTPERARQELTALAESRKDVPLPQPAAVTDTVIAGATGRMAARVYRPAKKPAATVVFFHGGGWVAGDPLLRSFARSATIMRAPGRSRRCRHDV